MRTDSEGAPLLVSADWILPVAEPPISDGAVLVVDESVLAVGPASDLRAAAPEAREERFLGGVILPGLVNAHTHLSLTALEGASPPAQFTDWLDAVVPRIKRMDAVQLLASARAGAERMLAAGITCVGDVTYRDESVAPAAAAGLAGVFFREVLGMSGGEVEGHLADTGFPPELPSDRVRAGLSAHSPYSTGPGAIRETHYLARHGRMPVMMHVAESPAEDELLHFGEGRLASLAARLAPDFDPPGTGTVQYLHEIGVLEDLVCVHAVHVDATEVDLLARHARGVVLCPRSNLYLECGAPPIRAYEAAGVTLALGTDSIASNRDFDLFEEARAAREIDPGLSADRLLEMMTSGGAQVLGLEGHGTLAAGSPADLVAIALGETDDPARDLIATVRRKDITAVMSAGSWRWRRERG